MGAGPSCSFGYDNPSGTIWNVCKTEIYGVGSNGYRPWREVWVCRSTILIGQSEEGSAGGCTMRRRLLRMYGKGKSARERVGFPRKKLMDGEHGVLLEQFQSIA